MGTSWRLSSTYPSSADLLASAGMNFIGVAAEGLFACLVIRRENPSAQDADFAFSSRAADWPWLWRCVTSLSAWVSSSDFFLKQSWALGSMECSAFRSTGTSASAPV